MIRTASRIAWWSVENMAPGRLALRVDGKKVALIETLGEGLLVTYRLKIKGGGQFWESTDRESLEELGAVLCAPEATPMQCLVDGRQVLMLEAIPPEEIDCGPDEVPVIRVVADGLVRIESARDLRVIR